MSKILLYVIYNSKWLHVEFEDYIPVSRSLTFALVSNSSSCVDISLIDDAVLENDETFTLESVNTSLVTAIPPAVTITIVNDDCKLWLNFQVVEANNSFHFSTTAAFVSFTNASYDVIEPGMVEVGVVLIGNLSFPVDIVAEVIFASAIRKPEQKKFTHWRIC